MINQDSDLQPANVRAEQFFIAAAPGECVHCARLIPLIALGVPAGHERRDEEGWAITAQASLLFEVAWLAPEVRALLRDMFPHFRPGAAPDSPWLNHCDHCGHGQDDYWLQGEPGALFLPLMPEAAERIDLIRLYAPLAAAVRGFAEGVPHLDAMRHIG